MKVSSLKNYAEQFLIDHGDGEVKILWEQGLFDEGFDAKCYEVPTDCRAVPDWPLPGTSLMMVDESPAIDFVLLYGEKQSVI